VIHKRSRPGTKIGEGDVGVPCLNVFAQPVDMGFNVAGKTVGTQYARPAVEELECFRARLDLGIGILGDGTA